MKEIIECAEKIKEMCRTISCHECVFNEEKGTEEVNCFLSYTLPDDWNIPQPKPTTFGELIKQKREEKGWSLEELTIKVNSTNGYMQDIKKDNDFLNDEFALKICKTLQINPSDYPEIFEQVWRVK